MDAYQQLVKIAPPPKKPYVEEVDWPALETEFGLAFPDDYQWFVRTYGAGTFGEWLYLWAPFAPPAAPGETNERNFKRGVIVTCDMFRSDRDEHGFETPYPIYPESGGMLPCAQLEDAATLNWITTGAPNDWWILLRDPKGIDYEEFRRGGLVRFLVEFLSGRVKSEFFTLESFASSPQKFRPYSPS